MRKLNHVLMWTLFLSIQSIIISCSSDDSVDEPIDEIESTRLPKAIYDHGNFTASYILDTDQDGDKDIILGPHIGLSADVLLINDGTGNFQIKENAFPARYKGSVANTVTISSEDFNGDGRPDIITSTIDATEGSFSESAQIHLYLNNGDNTFSDGTNQINDNLIEVGWVEWIRTGDFNNDGNIDFLTTASGGFGMDPSNGVFLGGYIYLNDGNANFSRTIIRMNDNGDLGEYTFEVLTWDEAQNGEARMGRFPLDIFVGDVDNDGDVDLVAPNGYADGQWATFINISTGTEVSFEVILNGNHNSDPYDEARFKNGALLDINGDGFLDVIGSASISGLPNETVEIVTALNDGTGRFTETTGLITGATPGVNHARQWLVADFDANGNNDLFIADHGYDFWPFPGYPNTFLMGSGSELINSSSNVGTASAFTHGAAVGDIDGNGTLDLFMNNIQGLENIGGASSDFFIYLNDGSGNFSGSK
ncbi:FG-GAP repeat domain-containing protein [Ekhidna sp.]|uniref:FG-GAP repeat domain-containing protein n=1 Tax=Ekhidna sp. TaxID=2608089 RepID=UPI003B5013F5